MQDVPEERQGPRACSSMVALSHFSTHSLFRRTKAHRQDLDVNLLEICFEVASHIDLANPAGLSWLLPCDIE
jgi:hypothetical protein